MAPPTLRLAQDPEADALLARDPLALLMGMLLDQQFPLEWAFRAPWRLAQRMERTSLDAAELADWDPEAFVKLMAGPPALHRYPASMAVRVQALFRIVVDDYGGDAAALWRTAATGSWRLEDATLVVTLEPCAMCAGALVNSRVARVVFGAADMKAGALGSLYNLGADPRLNHEFEVVAGVRSGESAALLTDFFSKLRS